jgi:hypothetical protein
MTPSETYRHDIVTGAVYGSLAAMADLKLSASEAVTVSVSVLCEILRVHAKAVKEFPASDDEKFFASMRNMVAMLGDDFAQLSKQATVDDWIAYLDRTRVMDAREESRQ